MCEFKHEYEYEYMVNMLDNNRWNINNFLFQNIMLKRTDVPVRPPSRLGSSSADKQNAKTSLAQVVGIPEKLISGCRPFPRHDDMQEDKQNQIILAPKKQQKGNKVSKQFFSDHVFRRRVQSDITNVLQVKDKKSQKKDKKLVKQKVARLQQIIPKQYALPYSQVLRKEPQNQTCTKKPARLGDEDKSIARRVRERIEAENAAREEVKKRRSIGEQAYIPFNLAELRNKIQQKRVKISRPEEQ